MQPPLAKATGSRKHWKRLAGRGPLNPVSFCASCKRNFGELDMRTLMQVAIMAGLAALCTNPSARAENAAPGTPAGQAEAKRLAELPPVTPPTGRRSVVEDHSGRKQVGKASVYSHHFDGRHMASGQRYNPHAHVAASKSLPLGTTAKVTNVETGKSAAVSVEDHGPHVKGRVMDVTPKVAEEIGLDHKDGVAPVVIAPIAVPQEDGTVKAGAGAAEPH